MSLQELYKLAFQNKLTFETALEYIELAAKAIDPNVNYDASNTAMILQSGFGGSIINTATEAIEKNPEKVGFQVIKIYNVKGQLLKVITEKLK